MAHLRLFKGNRPQRIEIAEDRCVIGRNRDCHVVFDDDAVSRRHARIVRQGDAYVLEDLGSRNKTHLNGNLVHGSAALFDNDIIRICNHHIIFLTDSTDDSKQRVVVIAAKEDSTRVKASHDTAGSSSDLGLVHTAQPREKLEALREINRTLVALLRVDALTGRVLESLLKIFPQCDRAYILVRGEGHDDFVPKAVRSRRGLEDTSVRISRTVLHQVLDGGRALLAEDAYIDPQLGSQGSISDNAIRSIMCVPLKAESDVAFGAIWLHTEDQRRQFKEDDLDLLVSVSGMVALSLERARLHEELLIEDRIKNEVLAGRNIQQAFLPMDWPFVEGYRFYANYESAQNVGGDYYGFIHLPGGRLVITLGDVSGKGPSAALLMARLSSELRYAAINTADPAGAVRSLNKLIEDDWPTDRFVSLLYMMLDLNDHSLSIVNAGHMPVLFRSPDGTVHLIEQEQRGPPLNASPGYNYESLSLTLKHGGTVLAYTDGVTEARNQADKSFGLERLKRVFGDAPADPSEAGDAVIQSVRRFAAGHTQFDDIALICFGREEE